MDANAGNPRHGRSQSVRSSEEASNDRGAKGHRKLVGAMTVEGYKRSSIVPQRLFVLEPQRPPEAGLLSEGPRQRERSASCAAWMGQSSVCNVRVSPFRETSDRKAGCPKWACPVWREGRGSNPRPYPYRTRMCEMSGLRISLSTVNRAAAQRGLGYWSGKDQADYGIIGPREICPSPRISQPVLHETPR